MSTLEDKALGRVAALAEDKALGRAGAFAALFGFLFGLAMILPTLWWRGYVIQTLWRWFVVPLGASFGFPPIGVPSIYAIVGALFLLAACLPRPQFYENQVHKSSAWNLAMNLLWPLGFLSIGWLWQWAQWGL